MHEASPAHLSLEVSSGFALLAVVLTPVACLSTKAPKQTGTIQAAVELINAGRTEATR